MADQFDYLQNLRLRNLFKPADPVTGLSAIDTTGLFSPSVEPINSPNYKLRINPFEAPDSSLKGLRNRARPVMGQLKAALEAQPKREDHQLSKIGKALAIASGVIEGSQRGVTPGISLGKNLMDDPYERAHGDWTSKISRFKTLADIEDKEISDEEKLEMAIVADEAKMRDDFIKAVKTQSDMQVNDARAAELWNRMKTQGLSWGENKETGMLELRDIKTGKTIPINQVLPTPKQSADREFSMFMRKENVEQQNRIRLKGMDQAHAQLMEQLRQQGDERSIRLRNQLDMLSPTQRNAAFEGAYRQVMTMNPELRDRVFTNETGTWEYKKDKNGNIQNPELLRIFNNSVEELMKQRMGQPSSGMTTGGSMPRAGEGITTPSQNYTPSSSINSDLAKQAIAEFTAYNAGVPDNEKIPINDETVSQWIAENTNQDPVVKIPTTPDTGLEAFKSIPGIIRDNVSFGVDPNRIPPVIQSTDPNQDVGFSRIQGLINSLRNTPETVYGPQSKRFGQGR